MEPTRPSRPPATAAAWSRRPVRRVLAVREHRDVRVEGREARIHVLLEGELLAGHDRDRLRHLRDMLQRRGVGAGRGRGARTLGHAGDPRLAGEGIPYPAPHPALVDAQPLAQVLAHAVRLDHRQPQGHRLEFQALHRLHAADGLDLQSAQPFRHDLVPLQARELGRIADAQVVAQGAQRQVDQIRLDPRGHHLIALHEGNVTLLGRDKDGGGRISGRPLHVAHVPTSPRIPKGYR